MRHAARRDAIASRPSKKGQEYPRSARIVRKADFDAVYRNGKRRSSSHFTVFLKANDLAESRFGFSIKRALGGAVVRNRIRRRIRELVRLHRKEISAGWDFVIHPKANVEHAAFPALESELVRLLKV
ncbi:MAG TPA: ribonuclease P protein component [Candidatus Bathyarchaeia archaeon]|nr:ribonuclease P protein component [Candidatus Bathyarchaeia archaeon]